MVAPAVTFRETLTSDLTRALARATDEKLVVFKRTASTLGIASVNADRSLSVKPYVLTITGDAIGEVTCNCPAGLKARTCKRLAAGLFARKHHIYAKAPQSVTIPVANDPLADLFK